MKPRARLRWVDHPVYGEAIAFSAPYNRLFIDLIKRVPPWQRIWSSGERLWFFDPAIRETVFAIARMAYDLFWNPNVVGHWPSAKPRKDGDLDSDWLGEMRRGRGRGRKKRRKRVERIERKENRERKPTDIPIDFFSRTKIGSDDFRALKIPVSSSLAEAKASYRTLVARHHTDVGGNIDRIKILNVAWNRISKHFRATR
jgi:hypothetical protein